jgi:toxin-antitoxin system PIN domain toxin
MILCDVNIFIYAFRDDSPHHRPLRSWLEKELNGNRPFAISDFVLSGFIRICTHPRIFKMPSPLKDVLAFIDPIRSHINAVSVQPGTQHWQIFSQLCLHSNCVGNAIPDAFFAALAIESGCTWISTDADYSRFKGLRWYNPLGK